MLDATSILFITLDSCRYDTFVAADAPNLKSVGPVHLAHAPGYFTYASHQAMFVGFTPGNISLQEPYANPRLGRIFRVLAPAPERPADFMVLGGANIVQGLKQLGFFTLGAGAVGWFDPSTPTAAPLVRDFQRYYFPGDTHSLRRQLAWIDQQLTQNGNPRVFLFLNIGETHMPYYHEGAEWPRQPNPCGPRVEQNDAAECRRRQKACLEFVDAHLGALLTRFRHATTVVCGDHGDAWGEDGQWGHSFHHPKVLEVPLVFRLGKSPAAESPPPSLFARLGRRLRRFTGF